MEVELEWSSGRALGSLAEGFLSVLWFQGCLRICPMDLVC